MMVSVPLLLAAAAAVPSPDPGDERTAILAIVHRFFEALEGRDPAAFAELLEPDGAILRFDLRDGDTRRPNRLGAIIANPPSVERGIVEKIGVPTVLQRGPLAQVWAPYALWEKGVKTHCGIDLFLLARAPGGYAWKISGLHYTMEPVARCAELGAPETPE